MLITESMKINVVLKITMTYANYRINENQCSVKNYDDVC